MSATFTTMPVAALTGAEREVIRLIAGGRTTREVAEERLVSIHTIRVQLYSIYDKLQIKHRGELILWAIRHGFVEGVE